jgi:hypothetical protein
LLGGLFARQGLKAVGVTEQFRHEFLQQAREQRERALAELVPQKLLAEALGWLADYRAEHAQHP